MTIHEQILIIEKQGIIFTVPNLVSSNTD